MGIVDGKIAIVTGSGRGVGRGEAMELAAQEPRSSFCDPGGSSKGEGNDTRPADDTVEIIKQGPGARPSRTTTTSVHGTAPRTSCARRSTPSAGSTSW